MDQSPRTPELAGFLSFHASTLEPRSFQFNRVIEGYYTPDALSSFGDPAAAPSEKVHVSKTLERALRWISEVNGAELDVLRLLQAVLHFSDTALWTRLRHVDINPESIVATMDAQIARYLDRRERRPDSAEGDPKTPEPDRPDLRTRIDRDPDDPAQLTPGVAVYAAALATMLRTATGEFCFGLLGPWGIGKTRLVRTLIPLLENPQRYKDKMEERGYDIEGDVFDRLRYEVVWYSAWKYRRPPEAWIFLYETLARRAMDTAIVERLCRVARSGVARRGYFPLVMGMLALGLFAIPQNEFWTQLFARGVGALGLAGLIYASGFIEGGGEKARAFAARYATLSRHGERLGLQALVGADLRALFLGWVPSVNREISGDGPTTTSKNVFSRIGPELSALALLAFVMWFGFAWNANRDGAFYFIFFMVWAALYVCVLAAAQSTLQSSDRVLLVIDDLDRCSPAEVIDIAESLKLLLEDDDVKQRVQVMMLVDETILRHAIASKFADLAVDDAGKVPDKLVLNGIVREHIEKLFALYLRLPALSSKEIGDLAELFAGGLKPTVPAPPRSEKVVVVAAATSPTASERSNSQPDPALSSNPPTEPSSFDPNPSPKAPPPERPKISGCSLRFTQSEVELLRGEVESALTPAGRVSPRAIRMFLFKYQLCRLLLRLSRVQNSYEEMGGDPRSIIAALKAAQNPGTAPNGDDKAKEKLHRIVAQVA